MKNGSDCAIFADITIYLGCVAVHYRWGGIFSDHHIFPTESLSERISKVSEYLDKLLSRVL